MMIRYLFPTACALFLGGMLGLTVVEFLQMAMGFPIVPTAQITIYGLCICLLLIIAWDFA